MGINHQRFEERKEQARQLYDSKRTIHNPYLGCEVVLNSDGFHHLKFSARRERNKKEQFLKFNLLPLALETIRLGTPFYSLSSKRARFMSLIR